MSPASNAKPCVPYKILDKLATDEQPS